MSSYEVRWSESALDCLAALKDPRVQAKLLDAADALADNPRQRGRPLADDLQGYWSLHWSRWRIVYNVDEERRAVYVLLVGQRHQGKPTDVYQVARRFLQQGLLEAPEQQTEQAEAPRPDLGE